MLKTDVNGTQQLLLYKLLAGTPGHDTGQGNPGLRALLSGRTPVKQCSNSTRVRLFQVSGCQPPPPLVTNSTAMSNRILVLAAFYLLVKLTVES